MIVRRRVPSVFQFYHTFGMCSEGLNSLAGNLVLVERVRDYWRRPVDKWHFQLCCVPLIFIINIFQRKELLQLHTSVLQTCVPWHNQDAKIKKPLLRTEPNDMLMLCYCTKIDIHSHDALSFIVKELVWKPYFAYWHTVVSHNEKRQVSSFFLPFYSINPQKIRTFKPLSPCIRSN